MDPTIKDFESASAELETIVKKMEEGDLTLEKALELYERGVQLSRFCHAKLEEAERRAGTKSGFIGPVELDVAMYADKISLSRGTSPVVVWKNFRLIPRTW